MRVEHVARNADDEHQRVLTARAGSRPRYVCVLSEHGHLSADLAIDHLSELLAFERRHLELAKHRALRRQCKHRLHPARARERAFAQGARNGLGIGDDAIVDELRGERRAACRRDAAAAADGPADGRPMDRDGEQRLPRQGADVHRGLAVATGTGVGDGIGA